MGLPKHEEYRAWADECKQKAAFTVDPGAQSEWLKLAKSWQALADGTAREAFSLATY